MTSRVAHHTLPPSLSRLWYKNTIGCFSFRQPPITRDCTGSFLQLLLLIRMQLLNPIILPYLLNQVRKAPRYSSLCYTP